VSLFSAKQSVGVASQFETHANQILVIARYFPLVDAFASPTNGMEDLVRSVKDTSRACADTSLLGSFSENHDNPRFPAKNNDIVLAKNVITFTMLMDGIPIIYQGQEQHYRGVGGEGDPYNREALWLSGYDQHHELYQLITLLNKVRKSAMSTDPAFLATQAEVVHDSAQTIAIQKGELLIVLTNAGSSSADHTRYVSSRFTAGSLLTDVLTCEKQTVKHNGTLDVTLEAGRPKVYSLNKRAGGTC
jgi:alpha-amylase